MGIIPESLTTKSRGYSESFYHSLIARYVSPFFSVTFKKVGLRNPNIVTLLSFLFILISSLMVLNVQMINGILYRVIIAVIIQLSFIFDVSDGQLARITGRSTKSGAWMDRTLDRIGEFSVFLCFGTLAWMQSGQIIFIILGLITGYGLSLFSMAMVLRESLYLENLELIVKLKKSGIKREGENGRIDLFSNRPKFKKIAPKFLFFLNFGIGERYLYLSFFIILNRVDIMLFISSVLTTLRFLSMTGMYWKKMIKYDNDINNLS